jgi:two-component system, chemotaxis family, CheB/CheR fusion protein
VEHLGQPIQDLEVSYRPIELRSPIAQATAERRPVSLKHVEMKIRDADPRTTPVRGIGAAAG